MCRSILLIACFLFGVLSVSPVKADIRSLSPDQKRLLREDVLPAIKKEVPSLFCGLNVAQFRAFEDAYSPLPRLGLRPSFHAVSFANGVGKTHMLILDMIGWTMGPDYLDWRAFPASAVDFYRSIEPLRKSGNMSLRLVCASEDMKKGGSVLTILQELFPWAKPANKDNTGCYRQIDVPHPDNPRVVNHIAVKTFDQTEVKHSGSTCQRIWINEIMPGSLLGETIGRIRSKKTESVEGTILNCATMLDQSAYLEEMEEDDGIRYKNTQGHLYENCAGEEVTDEMAKEVLRHTGNVLVKNPNGPGYITNGVLSFDSISSQIAIWRKTCPDQLEARMSGKFMGGSHRIFVTYDSQVHDASNDLYEDVPSGWPVVQVVDPHGAKPDFSMWALVTPMDRLITLAEWPTMDEFGPYHKIDGRKHTIGQTCEIWRRMELELGISKNIVVRVGDPNRFRENQPNTNTPLAELYLKHGFRFYTEVDDDMDTGYRLIHEQLHYDRLRWEMNPNDPSSLPNLIFLERCQNIRLAMVRHKRKGKRDIDAPLSEKVEEKYKEGADVVRYLCKYHQNHRFESLRQDVNKKTDMDAIRAGRTPGFVQGVTKRFASMVRRS